MAENNTLVKAVNVICWGGYNPLCMVLGLVGCDAGSSSSKEPEDTSVNNGWYNQNETTTSIWNPNTSDAFSAEDVAGDATKIIDTFTSYDAFIASDVDTVEVECKTIKYCEDLDGDFYSSAENCKDICETKPAPDKKAKFNKAAIDCVDNETHPDAAAIHPGAAEICDNVDNNCNGEIDTDTPEDQKHTWYANSDGDDFGNSEITKKECSKPTNGNWLDEGGDCDDSSDKVYPGHAEVCNDDLDNDCDGVVDRGYGANDEVILCLNASDKKFDGNEDFGDNAGLSVVAGDVACNPYDPVSLMVTAPYAGYNDGAKGAYTGFLFVIPGASSFFEGDEVVELHNMSSLGGAVLMGEGIYDYLGGVAIGKGDNDNCPWILWGGSEPAGDKSGGKAFLFEAGGQISGLIDMSDPKNYVAKFNGKYFASSPQKSSRLGQSMAIGDVNGDGYADFLLSANFYNTGGELYLVAGGPGLEGGSLDDMANAGKILELSGVGTSVSLAGNLNNNKYNKGTVVLSDAGYVDSNGETMGAQRLLFEDEFPFDATGKHGIDEFQNTYYPFVQITGINAAGGFGGSTPAYLADTNMLLASAMYDSKSFILQDPFNGSASFSVDDVSVAEFNGIPNETAGRFVASADINCDDNPDILILADATKFGTDVKVGGVYVFLGSANGWSGTFDLANADMKFVGEAFGTAGGGLSSLTVADFDGDGFPDIAIGAPAANSGAGRVNVFSGEKLDEQDYLKNSKCK